MKALIIGGGISGFCSALCLLKKGWSVQILEQAPCISEIGAGIQLSPNAMHVMQYIGLGPALKSAAFRPVASQLRDGMSGKVLMSSPMGSQMERQYGAPYLHIYRADLIAILRDALIAQSPDAIVLNAAVQGYDQDDNSISAKLADGSKISADIVIGADGIKSAIAKQMGGFEHHAPQFTGPRFTGNVAWRAVVPTDRLGRNIPPPAASVWMGQGKHAVTYLLGDGTMANFVGVVESAWDIESWSATGSKEEAMADFADWHPIITSLIENADMHHRWALYDRPPLSRWHDGRAVIIGDAAHAMLPFLAQGAAMAIEDSYVLAQMLSEHDGPQALPLFYKSRIDRTSKIQQAARDNMDLFHNNKGASDTMRKQSSLWLADKLTNHRAPQMKMDWIYRHNVTASPKT